MVILVIARGTGKCGIMCIPIAVCALFARRGDRPTVGEGVSFIR